MTTADWSQWDGPDLIMKLKLQPKASRDAFGEPQHDRLRVSITAPPVDGKANAHLVTWLAKQFGVAKSSILIEAGLTSQLKRVRIKSPACLPSAIASVIAAP